MTATVNDEISMIKKFFIHWILSNVRKTFMFYCNLKNCKNFVLQIFSFTVAILDCISGTVHVAG